MCIRDSVCAGHASSGVGGGRDLTDSGQFGRHINLHLTYSLQQQSKVSHIYSSHHPGQYLGSPGTIKYTKFEKLKYTF